MNHKFVSRLKKNGTCQMFKILASQKCKWTWACRIRIREETESRIRSKASQTLRGEFMKQIQLWHEALSTTIRAGWGWKWRKIRSPQIRMKEMACRIWNLLKAVGSAANLHKVSGLRLTSNLGTAQFGDEEFAKSATLSHRSWQDWRQNSLSYFGFS